MGSHEYSLIATIALISLLPFVVASGTCYIKFSIVFVLLRNALGVQQVPSNMTLNGIALFMSLFVMSPVIQQGVDHYRSSPPNLENVDSVINYFDTGLGGYRDYLKKYSDPELVSFFEKVHTGQYDGKHSSNNVSSEEPSLIVLLPAYALSELKAAFKIGFYLYLPFVVVDLIISSILLALGMMMMSPVTISAPIKLILFVSMDGWAILTKGLILQYVDLAHT